MNGATAATMAAWSSALISSAVTNALVSSASAPFRCRYSRQAQLTRAPIGLVGTGWHEVRESPAQRVTALTYDDMLSTKVVFGTAEQLIARLGELKQELGLNGIATELNPGGLLPFAQEMRSLEILTKHVMPKFK